MDLCFGIGALLLLLIAVTVRFAVVAFSVFVQGLTMPLLLRVIGEIPSVHKNEEVRSDGIGDEQSSLNSMAQLQWSHT